MTIGERIKIIRNNRGLTQRDLASKVGYNHHSTLARIETGEVEITHSKLVQFAKALGVSVSCLLGEEEEELKNYTANEGEKNKTIFANNLKYYVRMSGKSRREISESLAVSYYTFCDWINGKKYPRIDKIDLLAKYFGITKADLIEKKENPSKVTDKNESYSTLESSKQDVLKLIVRMQSDPEFFSIIENLSKLEEEQLLSIKQMLLAFSKND